MRCNITKITTIMLLLFSTTLTLARPVYMQVPQDLDHDGEADWAEVTTDEQPAIEGRPIHELVHTKNWPPYTLEIRMADGKIYMDQTSSLKSACHHVGEGRRIHSAFFDDGWIEKHLFLYSDEECKKLTDKLGDGVWHFEDIDRRIGSWKVD